MAVGSSERLTKQAGNHLVTWLLISAALVPAVLIADFLFMFLASFEPNPMGHHWFGWNEEIKGFLLMFILSAPFMFLFAILAAPFVFFRQRIVSLRFPFLRVGYITVAAYGPLLLALPYWLYPNRWGSYAIWVGLYELVALAATLLFVLIVKRYRLGERLSIG
jgi:hypothetical protein